MTNFDRDHETLDQDPGQGYPSPEDNNVNTWVKIIAIAGVIATAVLVWMDLLDKVGSWR
jgi:hypothetical protein